MAIVLKPVRRTIPADRPPPPPQLGRYRIHETLGQGSCGVVYRAVDIVIGRQVALKVLPAPRAGAKGAASDDEKRFLREAKAAGQITHPNVVTVFEVGGEPQKGLLYIAMELVTGNTLLSMLKRKQDFSFDVIRSIGAQVAGALEAAHGMKVIHRDIKPGNLMLTPSGAVKVVDFGIARTEDSRLTRAGTILGSPGYMSPEQIRGAGVDHRSDLFSLGSVLYELCTLTRAFPGSDLGELFKALVECQPVPVRSLRPEVPGDLEQVIRRALARDPSDRFQSASEMLAALSPADVPEVAPEAPTSPGAITVSRVRKRVRRAWVSGAGTTALIVLPLFLLYHAWGRGEEPAPAVIATGAVEQPAVEAKPAPLKRSETTVPARRSRPEAVEKATRIRVPARTTEPEPAMAPAGPLYALAVTHKHLMGSCSGTLRVFDDRVEYQAPGHEQDNQRWTYATIASVVLDGDTIKIVQARPGDDARKGKRRTWQIRSGDASLGAAAGYMKSRLPSP